MMVGLVVFSVAMMLFFLVGWGISLSSVKKAEHYAGSLVRFLKEINAFDKYVEWELLRNRKKQKEEIQEEVSEYDVDKM